LRWAAAWLREMTPAGLVAGMGLTFTVEPPVGHRAVTTRWHVCDHPAAARATPAGDGAWSTLCSNDRRGPTTPDAKPAPCVRGELEVSALRSRSCLLGALPAAARCQRRAHTGARDSS